MNPVRCGVTGMRWVPKWQGEYGSKMRVSACWSFVGINALERRLDEKGLNAECAEDAQSARRVRSETRTFGCRFAATAGIR